MPVTEPTLPPEALTPLEVIERARICAAAIRERAVEAEKARRQPVETIQELTGSGLTRLLTPRRWGGYELDFATVVEAVYEISKADASAGWCYSFLLLHNWLLAYYPEQAQHDVWASSPDVHMADSIIPAGQVTRVEGGYRISGNWPFVSGIDHSTWAMLAGMMPEPATGPFDFGPHLFLLPHSDFAIEDTWFVAGLEASGSQNVVVKDTFVPAHRVVSMLALLEGIAPGAQLHTNLMYHQPVLLHFPFGLTAPIVGAVMGAYELWCEMTRTKSTRLSHIPLTAFSHQQIRIAETSTEITTMQLLLQQNLERARSENPTLEQRVQSKRNFSYVAHLALQAIERIYITSGGTANYKSNPLQRFWRDIHAMAAHAALNWDTAGETFGLYEIGQRHNPRDSFV